MSKQNRVTPYGEIVVSSARGDLMGNRGILHDDQQRIVHLFKNKAWIVCRLDFKERRRVVMSPGSYTELFFLDEATALAAGHRPCFECQRERAKVFREAWIAANPELIEGNPVKLRQIDEVLHAERLTKERFIKDRRKQTFSAAIDDLPNGTFIEQERLPYLVWGESLYRWTAAGYLEPLQRLTGRQIVVLTPRSTVRTFAYGYVPMVHPTAAIEIATRFPRLY